MRTILPLLILSCALLLLSGCGGGGGGSSNEGRKIPRGSKIIFRSERDGNREIYSMNPDGTDQVNLTLNSETDSLGASRPTDSEPSSIPTEAGDFEIYSMKLDGSDVQQLTMHPTQDTSPIHSPDGMKILLPPSLREREPSKFTRWTSTAPTSENLSCGAGVWRQVQPPRDRDHLDRAR